MTGGKWGRCAFPLDITQPSYIQRAGELVPLRLQRVELRNNTSDSSVELVAWFQRDQVLRFSEVEPDVWIETAPAIQPRPDPASQRWGRTLEKLDAARQREGSLEALNDYAAKLAEKYGAEMLDPRAGSYPTTTYFTTYVATSGWPDPRDLFQYNAPPPPPPPKPKVAKAPEPEPAPAFSKFGRCIRFDPEKGE